MMNSKVLSLCCLLFLSQQAYAYLDPGAGSFILQMLIAGIMGALFTIKLYWYKVKVLVARLLGKEIEENNDEGDEDEEDEDK